MKSTRTRAKNDVISFRRSEPIILSDFLPQFYQGRVCKYAASISARLSINNYDPIMSLFYNYCPGYYIKDIIVSFLFIQEPNTILHIETSNLTIHKVENFGSNGEREKQGAYSNNTRVDEDTRRPGATLPSVDAEHGENVDNCLVADGAPDIVFEEEPRPASKHPSRPL
ncbi:hypothetical protein AVEN_249058-1, partial [Araneus ventricosus]